MIFYTARFVQSGFAATTLGLHSLLYALSKTYRLAAEVEAYREQARYYPDDRRPLFAQFIAYNYDLDISPEVALARLRQS